MSWLREFRAALGDQGHISTTQPVRSRSVERCYGPDGQLYDICVVRSGRVAIDGPDGRLAGTYTDVDEARARIAQQPTNQER